MLYFDESILSAHESGLFESLNVHKDPCSLDADWEDREAQ